MLSYVVLCRVVSHCNEMKRNVTLLYVMLCHVIYLLLLVLIYRSHMLTPRSRRLVRESGA